MKPDPAAVGGVVDWDAVRSRLAHCRRAIEGDGQEDAATVLARRALALAALAPAVHAPSPAEVPLEVLVFRCGGECYAFETMHVAHVAPRQALTRIAERQVVGDGLEPGVTFGPVQNLEQLQLVEALVDDARQHGAPAANSCVSHNCLKKLTS